MLDVIVADDDDTYRDTILEVLEKDGYKVGVAKTGREAFEMFRDNEVRLGVLDYRMPEMTGIEVVEALQEIGIFLKTILMTAESFDTFRNTLRIVKISKLLHKPFAMEEFRSAIEYLLIDE